MQRHPPGAIWLFYWPYGAVESTAGREYDTHSVQFLASPICLGSQAVNVARQLPRFKEG